MEPKRTAGRSLEEGAKHGEGLPKPAAGDRSFCPFRRPNREKVSPSWICPKKPSLRFLGAECRPRASRGPLHVEGGHFMSKIANEKWPSSRVRRAWHRADCRER